MTPDHARKLNPEYDLEIKRNQERWDRFQASKISQLESENKRLLSELADLQAKLGMKKSC